MLAAVVVQTELLRVRVVRDMSVSAGHAPIHVVRLPGERDVIRPNQAVPAVADLGAAPEIDACAAQHERALLCRAVQDGELDPSLGRGVGRDRLNRLRCGKFDRVFSSTSEISSGKRWSP